MKKFFKVFRAGSYPQGDITEADVQEIAATYDPAYHEAPLTVNHDDHSPAYAVVESVKAVGKDLYVAFKDVLAEAREINQKYKKPSVEITTYDGKKYLRAVTLTNFPAVKGLDTIKLQEQHNSVIFFSEDITLNLDKGQTMFNEHIIALAEKLNININDYSVEGDVIAKALEVIEGLKTQLAETSAKVSSLNVSLAKYEEAGITVEKFSELAKKNESLEAELKKLNADRIDALVQRYIETKEGGNPASGERIRRLAEAEYDETKKFVDGLPAKKLNVHLARPNDNGKEVTYEEVIKSPELARNFTEDELKELKKKSKTFSQ